MTCLSEWFIIAPFTIRDGLIFLGLVGMIGVCMLGYFAGRHEGRIEGWKARDHER